MQFSHVNKLNDHLYEDFIQHVRRRLSLQQEGLSVWKCCPSSKPCAHNPALTNISPLLIFQRFRNHSLPDTLFMFHQ